jgi:O-antigen ligase
MSLGAAAYCIAIAYAFRSRGRERAAWILLSMAIVAAFLLTGTRTSFVLLAAPVAVVIVDLWRRGRDGFRTGALPVVAQVAAVGIVLIASLGTVPPTPATGAVVDPSTSPTGRPPGSDRPVGSADPRVSVTPAPRDLEDRFSTLDDIASGRDQSLQLRLLVTRVAWQEFLESPLVGTGLGHVFSYMETTTIERRLLTLDTPMIALAKFGILGLLLFGVLVWAFLQVTRATIRRGGLSPQALTLIGYGAVLLALLPFGWPPEDKGTGFALVFILALAVVDRGPSAETEV